MDVTGRVELVGVEWTLLRFVSDGVESVPVHYPLEITGFAPRTGPAVRVQLDVSPTPPEHRFLSEDESSEVTPHLRASREHPPGRAWSAPSSARVARHDPGRGVA